jgi:hypothetical protein
LLKTRNFPVPETYLLWQSGQKKLKKKKKQRGSVLSKKSKNQQAKRGKLPPIELKHNVKKEKEFDRDLKMKIRKPMRQ